MKKRYLTIILIILAVVSATVATVYAKTFRNRFAEIIVASGGTTEDSYYIASITKFTDDDYNTILKKYKESGSWEKVAEYYGIKISDIECDVEYSKIIDKLEIPDDIYKEMRKSGMTDEECQSLMLNCYSKNYDLKVVWDAMKNGKTLGDLIREDTEQKNKKGQVAADLAFGVISEEEYVKKMQELSPEMKMSEILEFAAKEKKEWREMRIKGSGISEEEMKFAKEAGMTDIFEVCRIKDAEKISSKNFKEMVELVKKGEKTDDIIKGSVNKEKLKELQMKSEKEVK